MLHLKLSIKEDHSSLLGFIRDCTGEMKNICFGGLFGEELLSINELAVISALVSIL